MSADVGEVRNVSELTDGLGRFGGAMTSHASDHWRTTRGTHQASARGVPVSARRKPDGCVCSLLEQSDFDAYDSRELVGGWEDSHVARKMIHGLLNRNPEVNWHSSSGEVRRRALDAHRGRVRRCGAVPAGKRHRLRVTVI